MRMVLAAALALASSASGFAGVYDELMTVFTNGENRLPGSQAYGRSFQALEKTLRDAGLEPHVQTFDTLVPRTDRCRLSIAGKPVEPVFPINQGIAALVTDRPITGPLRWLGDGSLKAMEGLSVSGCVAVLQLDEPTLVLQNAFAKGARAVLLAGSGSGGRWKAPSFDGPVAIPCVFVPADEDGLRALRESEGAEVSLEVKTGLQDAQAQNLWVEIPGRTGVVFNLAMEEAALVSAPLDTYGWIPDRCPDVRGAANAALLAEALVRLARSEPPARSLIAVFWGARNWDQEGARHFYYALGTGSRLLTGESIQDRLAFSRTELEQVERLLRASERTDLLESRDLDAVTFVLRFREKLVGLVNNANATLRMARLERAALKPGTSAADARRAQLEAEIEALSARKALWNGLREQIAQRKRADGGAEGDAIFRETVEAVRRDLLARQAELTRALAHLETSQTIAERVADKALVAHFDFDFANAVAPWLPSVLEDPRPYTTQEPAVGGLLLHLSQLGAVYRDIRDPAWPAPLLESTLAPYYIPFNLSVPAERSVPTAPAALLGVPGFQLITAGEQLADDGMPTRVACDLRGLIEPMTALVRALGVREEFSLRRPFPAEQSQAALTYRYQGGKSYAGLQVINYARGSSDMEGAARNALLRLEIANRPRTPEFNRNAVVRVNTDGYVFMPMMSRKVTRTGYAAKVAAFGYDREGRLERVSYESPTALGVDSPRLPLFYQYGGGAFSFGFAPDPLGSSDLYKANTIDARTEAPFRTSAAVQSTPLQSFYADRPGRFKRIGSSGEILLGITERTPAGEGVPLDPSVLLNLDGTILAAWDGWRLNESRLLALRQRGSINDDLESVHADAAEHLELAEQAGRAGSFRLQQAHAIYATSLENRVYAPLRGIADDLVRAVVLLLILNIPFALAMERLVFGATSIYKQVAGVTAFFLATFGLLFVTHPAFSLASAPIIVFLAFVIIMLSAITTKLVLDKINKEIRAMQGLASKLHGRDESGTVMAAILIGVSGMRNRPLKTLLTAVTVVLLTFTILAFASLTAREGVVTTDLGKGQDEDRIELHRLSYQSIAPEMAEAIEAISGGRFRIFKRGWLLESHRDFDRVIYNPANGKTAPMGALLGLEPEELTANAKLAALLPGFKESDAARPPMYLPASIAERLEVAPGAELRVNGYPFVYAGPFDAAVLPAIETIDGMKILPPDFKSTSRNMGNDSAQTMDPRALEEMDRGNFAWYSPDRTAITDWKALRLRFGGGASLGYLLMYPKSGETDIEKTGVELARAFHGAVHAKSAAGAKKMFFTTAVEGSGFAEVIVPLLLGGLIIFSSLMGSIVDREREIYTYSAMGLSPPSVGALFFAESAIYSVVGGMGGYLLGQVTAKLAAFMGARGWITPPPMNFASLTSVLTIFVVMGVVLLSTIYPALKAGRSANPGVARKWKMPAPKGDRLDFIFPFTVSKNDFVGILSFIREHFANHADATLGGFAARNVKIFRNEGGSGGGIRLGIEADISLAPFDLGIFQRFRMVSKEFEIKGIEEVVVELERLAGTPSSWQRANRGFAEELREQFLLWRSLPIDTVEHYRRETETELGLSAGADGERTT